MNKVKISIITVTYNSVKTLEKTILSITEQSFNNYEFIIIDGGSTDGTIDIIKKYEDKISYWVSEHDDGIYDAMNKGIKKAKGNWIHLLNSDDYYHNKSVLMDISKHLIDENNFYYFSMIQKYNNFEKMYSWNSNRLKLWYSAYIPHPTMFVSKKSYLEVGLYSLQYKVAADHDMILRLISNNVNPIFSNEICTVMTIGGFSSLDINKTFNDFKNVTINNGLNKYIANLFYYIKIYKYKIMKKIKGLS